MKMRVARAGGVTWQEVTAWASWPAAVFGLDSRVPSLSSQSLFAPRLPMCHSYEADLLKWFDRLLGDLRKRIDANSRRLESTESPVILVSGWVGGWNTYCRAAHRELQPGGRCQVPAPP